MDYNSESFHPKLLGFILSYDYTMVRRYNHKEKHGKHLVFMTYVRPHKIDQLPRRCPQLSANPDQEDQIQVRKKIASYNSRPKGQGGVT